MSKSVLLIASTREAEEDLKFAETVIKRVMRKFRKPVRCDFLSHLVVGECARSETARRVVAAEIQGHDAVLWNCRSTRDSADLDQMRPRTGFVGSCSLYCRAVHNLPVL